MKIIFMGTPDFSAVVLEKLHAAYPVCAAVTAPDRPVGRGYKLCPSALRIKAEELGIPVLQYANVSKEGIEDIKALKPDIIVTAAFGQILSEELLNIPVYGVLNVHASLLPKYRGASPIQHAILNGESVTGITVMRTVRAVDAGDILLDARLEIGERETAGELFSRLAALGGETIRQAVYLVETGQAFFVPQDETLATHCGMITKADGRIDFSAEAKKIDRLVRAMNPWPSAYTILNGKVLKVFEIGIIDGVENLTGTGFVSGEKKHMSGTVVMADAKNGLIVAAGDNAFVRLKAVQIEGANRMSDTELLRGRRIDIGTVLG